MYPTPENPATGSFIKTQMDTLVQLGLHVEPFIITGRNSRLKYLSAVPQLRRRLARGDVNVVHANYVYAGLVARLQLRAPLVITYNGSDLLGPIGTVDGRKTLFNSAEAVLSRQLARYVAAAIVPSRAMASLIEDHADVRVIPHGVDMKLFSPTDRSEARELLGLDQERRYLLFAADPSRKVKNYPLAQAAVASLRGEFPDLELVVTKDESQARLALYMSACDALVFTSFQEGSPNVVKQAMACNLPIVSTDVGDVSEIVEGVSGCTICQPAARSFHDALAPLLHEPRRTEGRNAVMHLDRVAVARRVADLYAEVTMRTRRGNV